MYKSLEEEAPASVEDGVGALRLDGGAAGAGDLDDAEASSHDELNENMQIPNVEEGEGDVEAEAQAEENKEDSEASVDESADERAALELEAAAHAAPNPNKYAQFKKEDKKKMQELETKFLQTRVRDHAAQLQRWSRSKGARVPRTVIPLFVPSEGHFKVDIEHGKKSTVNRAQEVVALTEMYLPAFGMNYFDHMVAFLTETTAGQIAVEAAVRTFKSDQDKNESKNKERKRSSISPGLKDALHELVEVSFFFFFSLSLSLPSDNVRLKLFPFLIFHLFLCLYMLIFR